MPDFNDIDIIYPPDPGIKNLERINEYLMQSYSKGDISEEFKKKVKLKEIFIEQGIKLIKNNQCPFCEQDLNETALALIEQYNKYISDQETKIRRMSQEHLGTIKEIKQLIAIKKEQCYKNAEKFNRIKEYIPSMSKIMLPPIDDDIDQFELLFSELEDALLKKINDISISYNQKDTITKIEQLIKTLSEKIEFYNSNINEINRKKDQIDREKLSLRRRICDAAYMELYNSQIEKISKIKKLEFKLKDIQNQIDDLESQFKEKKKDKITKTFKDYLQKYFGDKYTFDERKFCLRLKDTLLEDYADEFLSDGEKSIIAFLYFLASTHRDVNKKSDYKKLFYVIDDPVSSMDFDFVYAISNTIRELYQEQKNPILLFTHNLEFMSILIRNNIIGKSFILASNRIEQLGKQFIMPYEAHLRDVYHVAKREKKPSHTTPNSIRHILETLWKFECPKIKSLGAYIKEQKIDEKNAFLNTLIQDSSHGIIRTQPALTPEVIINACIEVINYISKKHYGQIEYIDSNFQPIKNKIS